MSWAALRIIESRTPARSVDDDADDRNPYASPLLADDLGGLPPVLVITAQYDVLRDEGQAYAARLHDAGVRVRASNYETSLHAFFTAGKLSESHESRP